MLTRVLFQFPIFQLILGHSPPPLWMPERSVFVQSSWAVSESNWRILLKDFGVMSSIGVCHSCSRSLAGHGNLAPPASLAEVCTPCVQTAFDVVRDHLRETRCPDTSDIHGCKENGLSRGGGYNCTR